MKNKKHKEIKAIRWELVHSAGCIDRNCATHYVRNKNELNESLTYLKSNKPISVPKSLRHILGRYIQGIK